jgi:WhiB family redox-sensing transcriptional regulator
MDTIGRRTLLPADPPWHARARCRDDDPDRWFPNSWPAAERAIEVCRACPVRTECADDGQDERFGVWGGQWHRDRRRAA